MVSERRASVNYLRGFVIFHLDPLMITQCCRRESCGPHDAGMLPEERRSQLRAYNILNLIDPSFLAKEQSCQPIMWLK